MTATLKRLLPARLRAPLLAASFVFFSVCCAPGPGEPASASAAAGPAASDGTPPSADAPSPPAPEPESLKVFTDIDFERHLQKLRKKIPDDGFTVVVQRPFVVIGDEAPVIVRRRAEKTVKWAADRLKAKFFDRDPEHIYDIWLFKDDGSYRKHAAEIFGDTTDTPFGYSSPVHRALIMNIATGGGTLVHEIVHPFVASDFPGCPSWFNEGLGSLYEQCHDRDGEIWGLTNWRLAGLQDAIRDGRIPSFETLTATSTSEFYNEDPGTNYAQARYLCFFLQEKGLLPRFYREFRENRETDPTGLETLRNVLGKDDLKSFQIQWEEFVLDLHFP